MSLQQSSSLHIDLNVTPTTPTTTPTTTSTEEQIELDTTRNNSTTTTTQPTVTPTATHHHHHHHSQTIVDELSRFIVYNHPQKQDIVQLSLKHKILILFVPLFIHVDNNNNNNTSENNENNDDDDEQLKKVIQKAHERNEQLMIKICQLFVRMVQLNTIPIIITTVIDDHFLHEQQQQQQQQPYYHQQSEETRKQVMSCYQAKIDEFFCANRQQQQQQQSNLPMNLVDEPLSQDTTSTTDNTNTTNADNTTNNNNNEMSAYNQWSPLISSLYRVCDIAALYPQPPQPQPPPTTTTTTTTTVPQQQQQVQEQSQQQPQQPQQERVRRTSRIGKFIKRWSNSITSSSNSSNSSSSSNNGDMESSSGGGEQQYYRPIRHRHSVPYGTIDFQQLQHLQYLHHQKKQQFLRQQQQKNQQQQQQQKIHQQQQQQQLLLLYSGVNQTRINELLQLPNDLFLLDNGIVTAHSSSHYLDDSQALMKLLIGSGSAKSAHGGANNGSDQETRCSLDLGYDTAQQLQDFFLLARALLEQQGTDMSVPSRQSIDAGEKLVSRLIPGRRRMKRASCDVDGASSSSSSSNSGYNGSSLRRYHSSGSRSRGDRNSLGAVCCFQSADMDQVHARMLAARLTVGDVLQDNTLRQYLKLFCTNDLSLENIMFYEAVRVYKKGFVRSSDEGEEDLAIQEENRANLAIMAGQMMLVFFGKGSCNELNISEALINQTKEKFEKKGATKTLFDSVWCVIQSDQMKATFLRFRKSQEYADMINYMLQR